MNAQTAIKPETIYSAMAAAFAEIASAIKTNTGQVGQQKYKYADIASVIDAIKPALVNHDLFFVQRPQPSEHGVTIETIVGHSSGEQMSLGTLFVPANKNDAQGYGSALTYARRYALVTAFGVPVEDDDGNAATRTAQALAQAPADNTKREPQHSALKTKVRAFVHELNGCGDGDELSAFLATPESIMIVNEVREKLPHWWTGWDEQPDGFIPLGELITRRQRECAQASADYMTV